MSSCLYGFKSRIMCMIIFWWEQFGAVMVVSLPLVVSSTRWVSHLNCPQIPLHHHHHHYPPSSCRLCAVIYCDPQQFIALCVLSKSNSNPLPASPAIPNQLSACIHHRSFPCTAISPRHFIPRTPGIPQRNSWQWFSCESAAEQTIKQWKEMLFVGLNRAGGPVSHRSQLNVPLWPVVLWPHINHSV